MSQTIEQLNTRVEELERLVAAMSADKTKKVKKEKKEKKEKPEKPERKKRGMTGYNLFLKEKRAEIKEKLIESGVEPTKSAVMGEVGRQWKERDDQEVWNERAKSESGVMVEFEDCELVLEEQED